MFQTNRDKIENMDECHSILFWSCPCSFAPFFFWVYTVSCKSDLLKILLLLYRAFKRNVVATGAYFKYHYLVHGLCMVRGLYFCEFAYLEISKFFWNNKLIWSWISVNQPLLSIWWQQGIRHILMFLYHSSGYVVDLRCHDSFKVIATKLLTEGAFFLFTCPSWSWSHVKRSWKKYLWRMNWGETAAVLRMPQK